MSLAAGLGNLLLFRFSQFGPRPFETLPVAAVIAFGLLFTGLLLDLRPEPAERARREPERQGPDADPTPRAGGTRRLGAAGRYALWLGVLLGVIAISLLEPRYAVAPAALLLTAAALACLPARLGTMFGAMLTYIACTVLANFTLDSFLPVGSFFLVNVGTLFFGVTFTQRDRVHAFGRGPVYAMIGVAAVANVVAALALGTPLRYVAVSMMSILLSETADTEVYQRLLKRRWLTRVLSSNAVSAPLDTIVFTLFAFVGEPFATVTWLARVILTDVVVKFVSGLAAALGLLGFARLIGGRARQFLGAHPRDPGPSGKALPREGHEGLVP